MDKVFIVLCIVLAAALLFVLLKKNKKQPEQEKEEKDSPILDYTGKYKKTFLLSINEKNNYGKLKEICDKYDLWLFSKVRMRDILTPTTKEYVYSNKVDKKHLDFVVLNKTGFTVCAIELDDNSHNTEAAQKRDNDKDRIFASVGIPLLRYRYIDANCENAIRELAAKQSAYQKPLN